MDALTPPVAGALVAGRYRIVRRIGAGGMGDVFLALQVSLGREVALKLLRPQLHQDAGAVQRFQREAQVLAKLDSPHVVAALDAGVDDDGRMYIAMELLRGTTLRALVTETGPMSWQRTLAVVEDVARALQVAHDAGVIHRDLKLENVMLVGAGARADFVKVLDFGIAKLVRTTDVRLTADGTAPGTPGYVSPEQMLGVHDDPRSDLYALGVMWFELLTGRAPHEARDPVHLMLSHLTERPPGVRDLDAGRGVPAAVAGLVDELLAKDPAQRPADARALLQRIDALRRATPDTDLKLQLPVTGAAVVTTPLLAMVPGLLPTSNTETGTALATPTPPRRRRTALAVAASLVVVVVLGAGAVGLWERASSRRATGDPLVRAWLDEASRDFLRAEFDRAARGVDAALQKQPDDALGLLLQATIARFDDPGQTRVEELEARALAAATSPSPRDELVRIVLDPDHARQAERIAQRGDDHDDRALALQLVADHRMYEGTVDDRVARYAAAIAVGDAPVSYFGEAVVQVDHGRLDDAERTVDAGLARHPTTLRLQAVKGELLVARGALSDARARFERVVREQPGDVAAHQWLAGLAARRGDEATRRAELAFLTPQGAAPMRRAEMLFRHGLELGAVGRVREADELVDEAIALATAQDVPRALEMSVAQVELALTSERLVAATTRLRAATTLLLRLPLGSTTAERMATYLRAFESIVAMEQGDLATADALVTRVEQGPAELAPLAAYARWRVHLARGDFSAALATAGKVPPVCTRNSAFARIHAAAGDFVAERADLLRVVEARHRCTTSASFTHDVQGPLVAVAYVRLGLLDELDAHWPGPDEDLPVMVRARADR